MPKVTPTLTIVPASDSKEDQGIVLALQQAYIRLANALNNPDFGTTSQRPSSQLTTGQFFFDTTLGKPIWWNGTIPHWVDATGANV